MKRAKGRYNKHYTIKDIGQPRFDASVSPGAQLAIRGNNEPFQALVLVLFIECVRRERVILITIVWLTLQYVSGGSCM